MQSSVFRFSHDSPSYVLHKGSPPSPKIFIPELYDATIRSEWAEEIFFGIKNAFKLHLTLIENYQRIMFVNGHAVEKFHSFIFTVKKWVDEVAKGLCSNQSLPVDSIPLALTSFNYIYISMLFEKLNFIELCRGANINPSQVIKGLISESEKELFNFLILLIKGKIPTLLVHLLNQRKVDMAIELLKSGKAQQSLRIDYNNQGNTTLHYVLGGISKALKYFPDPNDRLSLVKAILDADPSLVRSMTDSLGQSIWSEDGQLPLHVELFHGECSSEIVKLLVDQWPASLSIDCYLNNSHLQTFYPPIPEAKEAVKDILLQGASDEKWREFQDIFDDGHEELQRYNSNPINAGDGNPRFHVLSFKEKYEAALQYEAFNSCFEEHGVGGPIRLVGFTSKPTARFAQVVERHEPERVWELIELVKIFRVHELTCPDLKAPKEFLDGDDAINDLNKLLADLSVSTDVISYPEIVASRNPSSDSDSSKPLESAVVESREDMSGTVTFALTLPQILAFGSRAKEAGEAAESKMHNLLAKYGIGTDLYKSEEQLKKDVTEGVPILSRDGYPVIKTPDLLFHQPIEINGYEVNWMDSKNGWVIPSLSSKYDVGRFLSQIVSYRRMFGPGMIIWSYGFFSELIEITPSGIVHMSRRLVWPEHLISEVSTPQVATMELLSADGVELRDSRRGYHVLSKSGKELLQIIRDIILRTKDASSGQLLKSQRLDNAEEESEKDL